MTVEEFVAGIFLFLFLQQTRKMKERKEKVWEALILKKEAQHLPPYLLSLELLECGVENRPGEM